MTAAGARRRDNFQPAWLHNSGALRRIARDRRVPHQHLGGDQQHADHHLRDHGLRDGLLLRGGRLLATLTCSWTSRPQGSGDHKVSVSVFVFPHRLLVGE